MVTTSRPTGRQNNQTAVELAHRKKLGRNFPLFARITSFGCHILPGRWFLLLLAGDWLSHLPVYDMEYIVLRCISLTQPASDTMMALVGRTRDSYAEEDSNDSGF